MTALLGDTGVWTDRIFSNGWTPSRGGVLGVTDKAAGDRIASVGLASVEDIATAADRAAQAQREWAQLSGVARGDVIRRLADLVVEHADELTTLLIRESGSTTAKASWEVHTTAREILEVAAMGSQAQGHLVASTDPARESIARRIPMGVAGIITPWNSPFILGLRVVAPALVTGNAVVLKPDLQTPISGGLAFARLLEEVGLPDGLFHVVPGGIDVGKALVADPNVTMVSFTGSIRGGRDVGASAGALLKRVSLELGGNNPYLVLGDADVEAAVSAGAWGSFFHQGQICLTAGRHLVDARIVDAYTEAMTNHARKLTVGDPNREDVHLGPIINERQAANVDRILSTSLEMGAELVVGGHRDGLFYQPTVVTGVTPGMPLFDEEIFGPIAAITSVGGDDEAVALANTTDFGLAAAVVSRDLGRARRVADRLHSGIVHINDQPAIHEAYGPIGGVGSSGNGYNYGTLSYADMFTEWQWLTVRQELPQYPF